MRRYTNEDGARQYAAESALCWGFCVVAPGGFYVGTRSELGRLPIYEINESAPEEPYDRDCNACGRSLGEDDHTLCGDCEAVAS